MGFRSSTKRALVGGLASLALAVPLSVGASTVQAESASASGWTTISQTNKCYTYSFGRMCTRTVTQLRDISYCTNVPITQRFIQSMAWATYCIRSTSTTYWP